MKITETRLNAYLKTRAYQPEVDLNGLDLETWWNSTEDSEVMLDLAKHFACLEEAIETVTQHAEMLSVPVEHLHYTVRTIIPYRLLMAYLLPELESWE